MAKKWNAGQALKKWTRGESMEAIAAFYGFSRFKLKRLLVDALKSESPKKTAKAKANDAMKTFAALRVAAREKRVKAMQRAKKRAKK